MALGVGLSSRASLQRRIVATLANTTPKSNRVSSRVLGFPQMVDDLYGQVTGLGEIVLSSENRVLLINLIDSLDNISLEEFEAQFRNILDAIRKEQNPSEVSFGNTKIRMGNSKVRMNGVGGGTSPKPVQNFSFGPVISTPGEDGSAVQNFSFGPVIGTPGEDTVVVQNFAFGPVISTPGEDTTAVQNFSFGPAASGEGESTSAVQNFSFGPAASGEGESTTDQQNFSFETSTTAASE